MVDLEERALRRDRRYLVRLLMALVIGAVVLVMLLQGLTGGEVGGCIADAYLGSGPRGAPAQ